MRIHLHPLTYETWSGEAAVAAHMQTPEITAASAALTDILIAPFTLTFLDVLSS